MFDTKKEVPSLELCKKLKELGYPQDGGGLNKKTLKDLYGQKKLSTHQIAKIYKKDSKTIYYWLKKFNIKTRSKSEAYHIRMGNHCNLSIEAKEWINGELLGDGCLLPKSNYSAYFSYGSKYEEYINYVSKTLSDFGIKQCGKIYRRFNKKTKTVDYKYTSLSYAELYDFYKMWYPNGRKIVPENLKLTPLTCRQWYIGDGCLVHPPKGNGRPYIVISTDNFSVDEVELLITKLKSLGFKASRHPSGNRIRISSYSVEDFLEYIGRCPVKCYQYKWKV